ncbi:hypothetical protein [Streptomyces iconiensis]|uniref:Secreted protein n=1 Tax=Streptomyces iconiensis TaxID=1384038 RepID=A0ABT6ZUM7_9ACTN|nr:hypothetical protein [Streptomyces iconiensis]MDJ1132760.1 hypothetical protein [Streptomyces iconiensis]
MNHLKQSLTALAVVAAAGAVLAPSPAHATAAPSQHASARGHAQAINSQCDPTLWGTISQDEVRWYYDRAQGMCVMADQERAPLRRDEYFDNYGDCEHTCGS